MVLVSQKYINSSVGIISNRSLKEHVSSSITTIEYLTVGLVDSTANEDKKLLSNMSSKALAKFFKEEEKHGSLF